MTEYIKPGDTSGQAVVERIEYRLKETNMSKKEFFKKSGISSGTLSQWRTGYCNPSKENIRKAAEATGLTESLLSSGMDSNFIMYRTPGRDLEFAVFSSVSRLNQTQLKSVAQYVRSLLSDETLPEEGRLLSLYRAASPQLREAIMKIASLAEPQEKNSGSAEVETAS